MIRNRNLYLLYIIKYNLQGVKKRRGRFRFATVGDILKVGCSLILQMKDLVRKFLKLFSYWIYRLKQKSYGCISKIAFFEKNIFIHFVFLFQFVFVVTKLQSFWRDRLKSTWFCKYYIFHRYREKIRSIAWILSE